MPLEAEVAPADEEADGVVVAGAAAADALDDEGELGAGADDVVDGVVDVAVLLLSGSVYCWSPADVPVPEASAVAVTSSATAASAAVQPRI